MASTRLDGLDPRFKPLAMEAIARLTEYGIAVKIISTLRTLKEQQEAVARGVSKTLNSKHLPQPPNDLSLAIDLCPYSIFDLHGPDKLQWDSKDPVWIYFGRVCEGLGLRWGGRFGESKPGEGDGWDSGHFELVLK